MTNKQIVEKLQEIEEKAPQRFAQFKLKDHLHWAHVPETNTLTWGWHPAFLGNLTSDVKIEVSKMMNKLRKSGYKPEVEKVAEEAK